MRRCSCMDEVNPSAGWPMWADPRHTSFTVSLSLARGETHDNLSPAALKRLSSHTGAKGGGGGGGGGGGASERGGSTNEKAMLYRLLQEEEDEELGINREKEREKERRGGRQVGLTAILGLDESRSRERAGTGGPRGGLAVFDEDNRLVSTRFFTGLDSEG